MTEEVIYSFKGLYRDDFRVKGYKFGEGEKSVCILGSLRGNEYQQIYVCSLLISELKKIEANGQLVKGHSIMVIPCGNPYSVNIKKRFWSIDNTDINRMFPGYDLGETTQRIAAGIFENIKDYKYGIQFASFYMPGYFVPQVRMMKTGNENVELARQFGLPFVVLHKPRPFDTATLNYNWQIWETDAFSIYTSSTEKIDKISAKQGVNAVLSFLSKEKIVEYHGFAGYKSRVVESEKFLSIRANEAGFLESLVKVGDNVMKGQVLAYITDPYTSEILQTVKASQDAIVAFEYDSPIAYKNTALFKLIPGRW
ncbi:MAG: succinylglutamate desuccinylase/aspartoacylase family protein [Butyrivibrio sp.]|uniref:M14 family metallopeptidase n=1 Tax=Butyrivibrio sp. TaxID=28121 RepID=UPI0025C5ADB8|nr:succinylglutamate desuccinylase/aspartoacylase family protein [Butyrivibrio sp.]MBQ6588556.1 succinylglutamate desuccinylase/aspartoacylase family protein [Butyrivibrio sp.]